MWDRLFKSVDLLQHGLAAAWERNTVIRHNIANTETPDFKASDVQFESLFADALQSAEGTGGFVGRKTNSRHIDIGSGAGVVRPEDVTPRVVANEDTSMRMDGNNVDIESENVKLAQNSLLYNTILTKLNSELARIKMAVSEGK
ncbi:MAG: flagellar basal body rod protein FlgB [Oscillospiraceae bacterium]|jgi:flagellar basal-body rod protein FlgB|nr:flagellar basal body rod protein FlgB [Oscillospiraceae bacterium]